MADVGISPFVKLPPISGYDFGTKVPPGGWVGNGLDYGWPVHLGTDFGTRPGEAIVASFPATVKFQTGLPGYGNRLTETFDNGWSLIFGHVAAGATGRVAPGQQIGVTGRNVGSAQGAVTLVELRNPQGKAVNPDSFIASLGQPRYGAASGQLTGQPGKPDPSLASLLPGGVFLQLAGQLPGAPGIVSSQVAATPVPSSISDPLGVSSAIAGIPTQIGHGLADFFATSEQNIAEWLKRQTVAFFVAAVVLLVLFA
jgi:hypothetical protein